jgi:hypothetical protein
MWAFSVLEVEDRRRGTVNSVRLKANLPDDARLISIADPHVSEQAPASHSMLATVAPRFGPPTHARPDKPPRRVSQRVEPEASLEGPSH